MTSNLFKCRNIISLIESAREELMSIEKGCGIDRDFEERIISEIADDVTDVLDKVGLYSEYLDACNENISARSAMMQAVYGPPSVFGLDEKLEG
ncbi:MAG: hypothetical protein NC340_07150 [Ruminococcus flavefaciens]|nr:hypothetical protein [Ruminococcus flavefaciens]